MPYRALAIDMMDGFRAAAAPDAKLRTLFGNVGDDFATGASFTNRSQWQYL